MDSSVALKDIIWFLRVCHHISNAVQRPIRVAKLPMRTKTSFTQQRKPEFTPVAPSITQVYISTANHNGGLNSKVFRIAFMNIPYQGGEGLVGANPSPSPEIPKVLQNRAKFNHIVKTV